MTLCLTLATSVTTASRFKCSADARATGPMALMVHFASAWVPFTSESKEAIAHYPEIIRETKLAIQECGRKLSLFLGRRRREAESANRRKFVEQYIPHIGIGLRNILGFSDRAEKDVVGRLEKMLHARK